jgi:hypothetical protein
VNIQLLLSVLHLISLGHLLAQRDGNGVHLQDRLGEIAHERRCLERRVAKVSLVTLAPLNSKSLKTRLGLLLMHTYSKVPRDSMRGGSKVKMGHD